MKWIKIINKNTDTICLKIGGKIVSLKWNDYNTNFISHPEEKRLCKLKDETIQKVNKVDDLLTDIIELLVKKKEKRIKQSEIIKDKDIDNTVKQIVLLLDLDKTNINKISQLILLKYKAIRRKTKL